MKVAALDLGTNTFLCLIAEIRDGRIIQIYDDQVRVVRLGQGVSESKKFHPEALRRARLCLQEFSKRIEIHKPDRILAMATSAARDVSNSHELLQIGAETGIPIEIIPGSKEAMITYRGSVSGLANDNKKRLVVDVGGGSTELILGQGQTVLFGESIDIGCVRLTEKYIKHQPVTRQDLKALEGNISAMLEQLQKKMKDQGPIDEILAVAGTPTELARIEIGQFDVEKIDGYYFTSTVLDEWIERFSQRTIAEIISDFGVNPGRADVILTGVLILRAVCRVFGKDKLIVSTRGVRFGVALEVGGRPQ
jgi:exopolyphosphatase / guanosine-5'-triphosphate,3'-diphosphate pyrophosphatase